METTNVKTKKSGIGLLVWIFAAIGALALLGVIVMVIGTIVFLSEEGIPGNTILEINFEQAFIEYVPDDPLAGAMLLDAVTVRDVVEALERASIDDRVTALVGRIGTGSIGLAQVQEIRDAIIAFGNTGKPTVAFSETFGEFGPGNVAYYLATAFNEIYMQPSGDIGLTGFMSESLFIKGTLDKLGLVPRGDHRKEYKNAFNLFTETKFTKYHREAVKKVIDSQFGQLVNAITDRRDLRDSNVRTLIDNGPFLGQEAVDEKLADGLAYRDEVYANVKEQAGEGAEYLNLSTYLKRAGRPNEKGTGVALIYGVGSISRGQSGFDPIFGGVSMGSATVARAFRDAVKDEDVEAILFRVDSPGGSYIASDTIWREVVNAREAGKPVIVSMGNVAGSGGYFVAMPADKIVAQPATITGSIGVLTLKMLSRGFWDKIGITWDEVHTSKNATAWSGLHDYTPEQWDRFQNWLDRVYDDFTTKVARGRDLPIERVQEVAKGRIWSGEDALELGLVDELGGFPAALRFVRESLDLAEDAPIHLKVFPKKRSFLETILKKGRENSKSTAVHELTVRVLKALKPAAGLFEQLGLTPEPGILTMPYIDPVH